MKLQSELQAKTLYVVATPIGNRGDLSPRAQAILAGVDHIAAEDTRHTRTLLQHFNIATRLIALHEHNEKEQAQALLALVAQGGTLALVSDAGTPLISDPGFHLIQIAHELGLHVRAIPGPCAAVAALSVAGLPTDRFCFEGFLPAKSIARQQVLQGLLPETRTLIFYEAPHRIVDSIADMIIVFGELRVATLVKELTKTFETVKKGSLVELAAWLGEDPKRTQGEFVVLLTGVAKPAASDFSPEAERTLKILLAQLPLKQAVQLTVQLTGMNKKPVYQAALDLQRDNDIL